MKPAAFEEKEYEAPLYNQLESHPNVWAPGQVFEAHIGIDRASLVNSPRFWRLLGRRDPAGVFLNRYDLDFIWRNRARRPLPNFRLNLFIQAKRPKYFKTPPSHMRAAGMSNRGWCFDVNADQQEALEKVAARLGGRAAVVYASPTFHTFSQLYAHTKLGTVIDNSTFPDVSFLTGHSRWYYDVPGGTGMANPNPEFHDGPSLEQIIERLHANREGESDNAAEQLRNLSKSVIDALHVGSERNARVAFYFDELRAIQRELQPYEQLGELVRPFFEVSAFTGIFNVEWFSVA